MSLQTDIIFVKALRSDTDLIKALPAADVYNTAIALPEQDALNAPLPYVIVFFDGMQNDQNTKDDEPYEGTDDTVQVSIGIAAATRSELATLITAVRKVIHDYFMEVSDDDEDYWLVPQDYNVSAQAVRYYDEKPCYWQILNYQCSTLNDIYHE